MSSSILHLCDLFNYTQAPRPAPTSPSGCSEEHYPRLSHVLFEEATKGFDVSCTNLELKREVLQMLPSLSQACRLCEIFLEHGEYM